MDEHEARRILARGCDGKQRFSAPDARDWAAEHGPTAHAYRCLVHPRHWHVGHLPSLYGLEQIAEALRVRAGNAPGPATVTPVTARRERRERISTP